MPTPFANLSFETGGTNPGDANVWSWNRTAGTHYAPWGALRQHADGFELGWNADTFFGTLAAAGSNPLQFTAPMPLPADDFELGWSNDAFEFILASSASFAFATGIANPTTEAFDDFERAGWSVVPFAFTLPATTTALFDSNTDPAEDFLDWWVPYLTAFAPGNLMDDTFTEAGVTGPIETFEGFKADQVITVTPPSTFTVPGHGFVNGNKVKFFAAIDGLSGLPSGLLDTIQYFIVSATTNTFQVSVTSGGAAVVMTDAGRGTNYVRTDTTQNWGGRDGDTSGSDP